MSETAVLEIVELDGGEIVLRNTENAQEPLLRINVSEQAAELLHQSRFDVAREMIDHAISRTQLWQGEAEAQEAQANGTVH